MKYFFVSCPIHFESELIKEIESFWHLLMDLDGLPTRESLPEFEIDKGGVLFKCSLHLGLQINFFSHIANRVLLRHIDFKARYFDQFEKEFKKIDFTKIFDFSKTNLTTNSKINVKINSKTIEQKISVEIESSKSRLFHEKNLIESITQILVNKKIQISDDAESRIFIRIFNDIVTISLDTSGEHLHFRGYRKHQGAAPLRENLAYLTLQIAGLMNSSPKTLLDPFCGSGTLLFESILWGIPQLNRRFPFFNFQITPALFKSPTWAKNYKWLKPVKNKLVGLEKDLETFQKSLLNQKIFSEIYFEPHINLIHADSLSFELSQLNMLEKNISPKNMSQQNPPFEDNLWIVTNPPYGERLSPEQVPAILKRFEDVPGLQGIVVLHPVEWKFYFKKFFLSQTIPFSNQGLKLSLSIFKKPSR